MTDMQLGRIRRGLKLSPEKLSEGLRAFRATIPAPCIRRLATGGGRIRRQEQDLLRAVFAKKLIELGEKQGLSQKEIAGRVGIHHSTVGVGEKLYRIYRSRR